VSSVSFLHIADLHLDSPFRGLVELPEKIYKRIQESTFVSFSKLISIAIREKVDFVLISGDLFDAEDRSIRAQARFRHQMQRLQAKDIPVYVIHGNHDHLGGDWYDIEWPSNVHVFISSKVEIKSFKRNQETLVNIYGFSYTQKAVVENMTALYKKQDSAKYHIGMLHGSIEGDSEHNRYAPFKISELHNADFDYWALGHIHKRQVLSENPLIIYPGNIQGRHRNEAGEKGGYIVTLSESETTYQFFNTADVMWEDVSISITDMSTTSQLYEKCMEKLDEVRKETEGVFLSIHLIGEGLLNDVVRNKGYIEDLLQALVDGEEENENFVYVLSIKVKSQNVVSREKLVEESPFINDMLSIFDSYQNFDEAVSSVFTHPRARKLLDSLTEVEKEEIIKEAEALLLNEIYQSFSKE